MAYKSKFLHFKTKASYNAERAKTTAGTEERKVFDAYISFIDEGPMICTWGKEYKCDISASEVEALVNAGKISPATVAPLIAGTAAVGTSTKYAREDHRHPAQTTVSGNAGTATKLATPRVIAIAGAVSGSATFDGSSNVSINSTLNGFDASKITSGTISEARLPNIPIEKLPAGALERMFVVESQTAAIDAVKAGTIQEGDVVQIGNGGLMYFCIDDAATTFGNAFKEFTAGSATSVPWSGVTGKPSSFTPSAHNQASNTITALTGYAKSTNAAITTSDTLNTALGKLETKVDITYGWGNHASAGYAKTTQLANYLPLSGGTLTGTLTVPNITINGNNINEIVKNSDDPSLTWTEAGTDNKRIPTIAKLAYWNGAYKNTLSNLQYCSSGEIASRTWVQGQGYLTSVPAQTWASITGKPTFATVATSGSYNDLTNKPTIPSAYTLPTASSTVLGGVKVGSNITLSSGTISLSKSNVTSALGFTPANVNEIPIALPNPYALTINGTSYRGSSAVSINTARILSTSTLSSSTVSAGYSYNNTSSRTISSLSGFSSSNPDSVIISTAKLTFTASNAIKMDGLADLSGTYYIYCLSYMANGKVAVNGAVYA